MTSRLTIPGVKHVSDEVVYEGDLRFGYAARVPVKHRHHHREPLSLLLVRLQQEGRKTARRRNVRKSAAYLEKGAFFSIFTTL